MKSILTSVLLIICVGVFGQKVVSRSTPLNTCDSPRIFRTDTLWYNEKYGIPIDTSLWYSVPKKDTVDVIALVGDTSKTKWESDGFIILPADEFGNLLFIYETFSIKCKAVRDYWQITEYLLPKKYIVWQSIIINKNK